MTGDPHYISDDQIDGLLTSVSDLLDIPSMTDAATAARARIEQRGLTSRAAGWPDDVIPLPGVETTPIPPPATETERLGRDETSRRRELALLAAGLAAAAIIGLVLTLVFRGFDSDSGDTPDPALADGPLAAEPYDIPGYEFVGTLGQPQVPNEPVDVAVGPDGTLFVLDQALHRVVAFTPEGEVKPDWGNQGYSAPLSNATALGVGKNGEVYVASDQVLVFNQHGQQVDSWPFPESGNEDTLSPSLRRLVVDSNNNIYVASTGIVWRFEAGTGVTTTIELDLDTDILIGTDSGGQLYAASYTGGIYRVDASGVLELVGLADVRRNINGFTVAPDGSFVLFESSTGGDDPSIIYVLNNDGSEIASWPIDRTGFFIGNLGPFWIGIDFTFDGTIALPDPLGHRISFYDIDGTLVSEIRDQRPDAFGRLWRIDIDGNGNVLAYDPSINPRVLRFSPSGELLKEMPFDAPLLGAMATLFDGNGFAATPNGGFVVFPQQLGPVSFFSPEGEPERQWTQADLQSEEGIAFGDVVTVDDQGFVYIVDEGFAGRLVDNLRKFTPDGEFVSEVGSIGYPARADIVYHGGAIWAVDDGAIVRYPDDGGDPRVVATFESDAGDGNLAGLPVTLALDPDGNILTYMLQFGAEQGQFAGILAQLDPQGNVIWTVDLAEDSANRYVDLAIAGDGTLYLSDSELRQILVYRPTGDADTPEPEPTPTEATIGEEVGLLPVTTAPELETFEFTSYIGESLIPNEPSDAIGVRDGRIFVSDRGLDRIIAFTPEGEVDTSWGIGGFSARLSEPARLALDPDGNLWASTVAGEVYRFDDPADPTLVWSLPEGGQVWGFAFDSTGRFYLADAATGTLITMGEDGVATNLGSIPRDVADMTIANDRIFIVMQQPRGDGIGRILVYDTSGARVDQWGDGGLTIGGLTQPSSITVSPDGYIVVAQRNDDPESGVEILVLTPDGEVITSWQTDVDDTLISNVDINSIGIDNSGRILIPDMIEPRVAVYSSDGDAEEAVLANPDGRFGRISSLTTGPDGDLYVLDDLMRRAQRFSPSGELLASYDFSDLGRLSAISQAHDLTVDETGRVYITVYWNQQIAVFAPDGERLTTFGNPGEVRFDDETSLFGPYGIGLAEGGTLLVTDEQSAGYIKRFTTDGEYLGRWLATEPNSLYVRFEVSDEEVFIMGDDGGFEGFDPEGNHVRTVPFERDVFSFDVDADSYIYITGLTPGEERQSDELTFELAIIDPAGNIIELIDLGASTQIPRVAISDDSKHLYITSGASAHVLAYEARGG